jgi:hypothetical protein
VDNDCDGRIDEAEKIIGVRFPCPITFAPIGCNKVDDDGNNVIDNWGEYYWEISEEENKILNSCSSNIPLQSESLYEPDNEGKLRPVSDTSIAVAYAKISSDDDFNCALSGEELNVDFTKEFVLLINLHAVWRSIGSHILVREIKVNDGTLYFTIVPCDDGYQLQTIKEYDSRNFLILPKDYFRNTLIFVYMGKQSDCSPINEDFCPYRP